MAVRVKSALAYADLDADERKTKTTLAFKGETDELSVHLRSDPAGLIELHPLPKTLIGIHVGGSVRVDCRRAGKSHSGFEVHGSIEIIPSGTPGRWETKDKATNLLLSLAPGVLHTAAQEFGYDPTKLEILNRFLVRDPQIEHIGWALKAEMEAGYPGGRLYFDGLARALAACLVRSHSSVSPQPRIYKGGMPNRILREVLSYIEDNLGRELP